MHWIYTIMKELIQRLKGETPIFFKWLQLMCAAIGTVCAAMYAVPNMPDIVYTILSYGICCTAVSILIAQLPLKNNQNDNGSSDIKKP